MAERSGRPIRFMEFLKIGVPATLLSLVLATLYILVRYV
jgi:Na+/H+ antiporter NhaD/arsenite permease-like protein